MDNEQKFTILKKLIKQCYYTSSSFNAFTLAKNLINIFPTTASWECTHKQKEIDGLWPLNIEDQRIYEGHSSFHLSYKKTNLVLELTLYDKHFMRYEQGDKRCTFITTITNYHESLDRIFEYCLNERVSSTIEDREERRKQKLFDDTKHELIKKLSNTKEIKNETTTK